MTLEVGALLQDKRYQIQAVLTSTDIETVYQAVHTYLARTVILKQLRQDVDWSGPVPPTGRAIMARLLRLAQCQHPCLGEVLDCFEEGGQVYLVLPTYSNLTMARWLQTHGPVNPSGMLAHLQSLVDIFDKFHENGLIYGQLSPHSLHYRAETNELLVTNFSWRMFIADLLGDRHCLNYAKSLDVQRLTYIAYSLLTGDCSAFSGAGAGFGSSNDKAAENLEAAEDGLQAGVDHSPHFDGADATIRTPKLNTIRLIASESLETVISNALYSLSAQSLTPTDWFIELQKALGSPSECDMQDEKSPESLLSKDSQVFNITPNTGETVLTQPTVEGSVLSKSKDEFPMVPTLGPSEEGMEENPIVLSNDPDGGEDGYGAALTQQRTHGTRWLRFKRGLPLLLGTTSIVAAVSGGVLGYVFRIQDVDQLEQSPLFGNEIFGRDQEFPPSEYWPGLSTDPESSPSVLFERSRTQNANRSTPTSEGDVVWSNNGAEVENSSASAVPLYDSTVPRRQADATTAAPVGRETGAGVSNDGQAPDANTIESDPDQSSEQELEPRPTQRTKPQQVPQQSTGSSPVPDVASEDSTIPPTIQPTIQAPPVRIEELPPGTRQSPGPTPSRERPFSEPAPSPNNGVPEQNSPKRPKLLITPVPSPQTQGIEVDSTDVSRRVNAENPA